MLGLIAVIFKNKKMEYKNNSYNTEYKFSLYFNFTKNYIQSIFILLFAKKRSSNLLYK